MGLSLIIGIVIAFLLVVVVYQLIHLALVKRATLVVQRQAQRETNQQVLPILQGLIGDAAPSDSQLVADVWGKGVLAFEYVVDLTALDAGQRAALTKAAVLDGLVDAGQAPAYRLTDWWTYEQTLHLEVAQLSNEATIEYVHDLKKLDQPVAGEE